MDELAFEWDDEKNKLNQKKHGISFEDAKFVFTDPKKLILPDILHSGNEERWLAIGLVNHLLFVVYTEKELNCYRLISARLATKAEMELYNDSNRET